MRRPRIKDCRAVAVELDRLAREVGGNGATQAAREHAQRCERMADWLRELATEMERQLDDVHRNSWELPHRAPIMRIPKR